MAVVLKKQRSHCLYILFTLTFFSEIQQIASIGGNSETRLPIKPSFLRIMMILMCLCGQGCGDLLSVSIKTKAVPHQLNGQAQGRFSSEWQRPNVRPTRFPVCG